MKRIAAASPVAIAVMLLVAASGCGGGEEVVTESPEEVLEQTFDGENDVVSGVLELDLEMTLDAEDLSATPTG